MAERRRLGEVDQDVEAAERRDGAAPPAPVLEAEHDRIGEGAFADRTGRNEGMGVKHRFNPAKNRRRGSGRA